MKALELVNGLLAGAATGLLLVACLRRMRRGPWPWTLRDGVLGLVLMVWLGSLAAVVSTRGPGLGQGGEATGEVPLGPALVGTAVAGLLASVFAWVRARPHRRRLGLVRPTAGHLGVAVLLVPVFLGVALAWSLLLEALGQPSEPQRIVEEILADPTAPAALFALVYGAFVAPLVEELLFRGLLLVPLAERHGAAVSVLLTGVVFGLLHLSDPASVVPLSLFGMALGGLRLWSGSLWPPVLLHVGNNTLAFSLALAGLG